MDAGIRDNVNKAAADVGSRRSVQEAGKEPVIAKDRQEKTAAADIDMQEASNASKEKRASADMHMQKASNALKEKTAAADIHKQADTTCKNSVKKKSQSTQESGKGVITAAAAAAGLLLSTALLMFSVYVVCYLNPGYFEREYAKHNVQAYLPEISMSHEDGLMAVTDHMMDYLLHGEKAEELQVEVLMGGERRGFFTDREIAHMWDVRRLFKKGIVLGWGSFITAVMLLILGRLYAERICRAAGRVAARQEADRAAGSETAVLRQTAKAGDAAGSAIMFRQAAGRGLLTGAGLMLAILALLSAYIVTNFSTAFITFHHIFFDNDLWLLDPQVDMMINIVPEGFFFDTALRIVVVYALLMLLLAAVSYRMMRKAKAS